ncbi:methyltransferase [Bacillus tianshenii]|uniref:Methyltransferase n=1 Tax=Sutcliffiella tianshenii TaxID=1463404 RepID=A0ABS2NZ22_9BACI|nr:isoprenylcysteine carboxylmethyltransferase family protein [Bacillus tianshenii]MBM7619475.1 methyltransferase [Bacillus tianshenii]
MFFLFYLFVICQRLVELKIAKRNENLMKKKGAVEFGQGHYGYMVLLHIAFLLALLIEVLYLSKEVSPFWPLLISLFIGTQVMRVWAIASLGMFWNTKIIILPNADVVKKGPYRFLRHPNYLVVSLEIIIIPLLFQAYITAFIFTILNAWMLSVRIPMEEKALNNTTSDYSNYVQEKSRFTPKI